MERDEAFECWKERAQERGLLAAAQEAGAKLRKVGSEWVGPCPECGGKRDKFAINPGKNKWVCHDYGGGSSNIGMLMHIARMSFTEAGTLLAGEPPPRGRARSLSAQEIREKDERRVRIAEQQRERERLEEERRAQRAATAAEVWGQSLAIAGTPAERYHLGRGLPMPPGGWPNCVRFHPRLVYELDKTKSFAAVVARVDDMAGNLTAVWRIYITSDGRKAPVEYPKLGLGPAMGGAVRLGGVADKVGLAEGYETGYGAWALNGFRFPVWPVLSTAGLLNVELPLQVKRAIIYPDGDPAMKKKDGEYVPTKEGIGIAKAKQGKVRLIQSGIKCLIAEAPLPGIDYCDIYNMSKGDFVGTS